jgi:hypothetical protein
MNNGWEVLYQEATQVRDPEKVSKACDRARHAINKRLTELAAQRMSAEEESERLREALRLLLVHECKVRPGQGLGESGPRGNWA